MQIIIVGCGKVGTALAAQLSQEDNNVTVVDKDSDVILYSINTRTGSVTVTYWQAASVS